VRVHLVNPSEVSFGTAVITPRWLYVLAAATPTSFGDPCIVDETLAVGEREAGRDPPALAFLVRHDEQDVGTVGHRMASLGR